MAHFLLEDNVKNVILVKVNAQGTTRCSQNNTHLQWTMFFFNTHFECVTSQKTLANIFRYNKKYKRKMFAFQNPYPLPKTNSTGLCAF
jgi:hypothetical protein